MLFIPETENEEKGHLNKYTKLKIEGQWSRMSILSNRLLKNYQSINQFTENDQWSMNSINRLIGLLAIAGLLK